MIPAGSPARKSAPAAACIDQPSDCFTAVTALLESPDSPPDCLVVVDEFARRLPALDLDALQLLLQLLERRLGTAAEQPCDLERAQALGHEIKNRYSSINLQQDVRRLGDPSAPFSA